MSLISLERAHYSLGDTVLLDEVDFSIAAGERVCLVGRNGVGKSTMMRILAAELKLDSGRIRRASHSRVAFLPQSVPTRVAASARTFVAQAFGPLGEKVAAYQMAAQQPDRQDEAARLFDAIDSENGWDIESRVDRALSAVGIDGEAEAQSLSGGQRRRLLLARALVLEPDVLLLDEPTNHLDLPAIEWLEGLLGSFTGAVLFTTHDRAFLRSLATRIIELDRGNLTSWPGDYDNYLRRQAERLNEEQRAEARQDKFLAEEEVWIRQGIKARRTRNEGRVRRLETLRGERRQRRQRLGKAEFKIDEADRSGKIVFEIEDLAFAYDDQVIVDGFSSIVQRGDRIGLLGPNGSGKTTVLRLLLGEQAPSRGKVEHGTKLAIAYFDQAREQLDDERRLSESVVEHGEFVGEGKNRRHVVSYLQDFLFPPSRARERVGVLSGGERNRLLLARMFARPANLLVLDEPTNDLDVETLELLEERLSEYQGTVIVVSHDREFLDNVVTATWAFDAPGQLHEYVGGYADWQKQRRTEPARETRSSPSRSDDRGVGRPERSANANASAKKLGFNEQRELARLPDRIHELELKVEALNELLASPDLYRTQADQVAERTAELNEANQALEAAFERWAELEAMAD